MYEYLTPLAEDARPLLPIVAQKKGKVRRRKTARSPSTAPPSCTSAASRRARTAPTAARSTAPNGSFLADIGEGNRKDIRNAVEAAHKAAGWSKATAHNRAQVLYYIAENLAVRADEFAARIAQQTGAKTLREVQASIERLFYWAAWADKYDGQAHQPPMHGITVALNEPVGVIGIVCPNENPLLGFISLVAPALALGNRVIAVPSEAHPLSALDLYQVLDTSDLPGGALNIVTGNRRRTGAHAGLALRRGCRVAPRRFGRRLRGSRAPVGRVAEAHLGRRRQGPRLVRCEAGLRQVPSCSMRARSRTSGFRTASKTPQPYIRNTRHSRAGGNPYSSAP
jgi:hypothetical protein